MFLTSTSDPSSRSHQRVRRKASQLPVAISKLNDASSVSWQAWKAEGFVERRRNCEEDVSTVAQGKWIAC